ncbi:hypothetical protein ARMGADRAFT_903963, partial [Armillaria gallica]
LWAVLVGINAYSSSSPPLHGCVSDVEKMVLFLINDLGMSEDHIQRLLTTSSDTSIDLEEHRRIQHGDNIIIYFSGHGASYRCSENYPAGDISTEGTIEALCPMDRTPSGTDISIPDISDREINTILTEISGTKGSHITFILDCCYSSSSTR